MFSSHENGGCVLRNLHDTHPSRNHKNYCTMTFISLE
jgi:hypothetical protein